MHRNAVEAAKRGTIRHRHNPYSSIGLAEIIQVRRSRQENQREDPTTFWGNGEWLWLGKKATRPSENIAAY
jgi:hypothetical protein